VIACISPGGLSLSSDDASAKRIFVATLAGVWTLQRASSNEPWEVVGHALDEHHVGSLVHLPEHGLTFAGAHSGGLFVSSDDGRTWATATNGIAPEHRHVFSLAAHRRANQVVLYAGTEPAALYRSFDLGATWSELPGVRGVAGTENWNFPVPPHIAHVKNVAVHPSEPSVLYVCIEQGALLKSVDDGATWFELSSYASPDDRWYHDAHRIVFRQSDPADLYLTSGEGLYHSTDAGKTWTHLTTRHDRIGYPDALFIDPDDERTVYIAGSGTSPDAWTAGPNGSGNPGILRSRDGGKSWHELDNGLPRPVHGNIEALSLHRWQSNVAFYAGTAVGEIFASSDRGESWARIAAGLPPISKVGHYKKFVETGRTTS
jgi:photosystem II stability/assembly factor-like uncharacterized protein